MPRPYCVEGQGNTGKRVPVTEPRRRLHLSPPLIEGLIIIALLLLPLLFWWQLWLPEPADRATIPEGDLSSQYYPLQLFAARELAAGRIPAWDPYLNAGQPGLADIQTGFYYPLNLLANLVLALLGWPFSMAALTGQIIFHFSLASLFTYLFVRHLARRAGARAPAARFAGAVAALSFTYAGYLTSFPVQQITILETAVWLPLVLLFLDRAFYSRQPWPQLILASVGRSPTDGHVRRLCRAGLQCRSVLPVIAGQPSLPVPPGEPADPAPGPGARCGPGDCSTGAYLAVHRPLQPRRTGL